MPPGSRRKLALRTTLPKTVDDIERLLTDNRIFKRYVNIGIAETRRQPIGGSPGRLLRRLRGCRICRRAQPYESTQDRFRRTDRATGDALRPYLVRVEEDAAIVRHHRQPASRAGGGRSRSMTARAPPPRAEMKQSDGSDDPSLSSCTPRATTYRPARPTRSSKAPKGRVRASISVRRREPAVPLQDTRAGLRLSQATEFMVARPHAGPNLVADNRLDGHRVRDDR